MRSISSLSTATAALLIAIGLAQGCGADDSDPPAPAVGEASEALSAAAWVDAGPMAFARAQHASTVLANGKVLVTGGFGDASSSSSADLFDPATQTWAAAAPMNSFHIGHQATLLLDGTVLVTGGAGCVVERYDPAVNVWTTEPPLSVACSPTAATRLADGRVLVAAAQTSEIYNPALHSWTATPALPTLVYPNVAVTLQGGAALLSGPGPGVDIALGVTVRYSPSTNTWTTLGAPSYRYHPASALLPSGRVLVVGGYDWDFGELATAEVFDPQLGVWTPVANMTLNRAHPAATLLKGGGVLVAGGQEFLTSGAVEIFDEQTGAWSPIVSMLQDRSQLSVVTLRDGSVLATGGQDGGQVVTASAERLLPACVTIRRGTFGAVDDAAIAVDPASPGLANTNFGSAAQLQAGLVGAGQRQSLLRFDLTSIAAGTSIMSSVMSLRDSGGGQGAASVHRVSAPWSESTVTWNQLAGAYDVTAESTLTASGAGFVAAPLGRLTQRWVDGSYANDGVLAQSNASAASYRSSEVGGALLRPRLDVCYVGPTCADGVKNGGETGVDCGGPCAACPTCSDGLQNGTETGVDCGGTCLPCQCTNGVLDANEAGVDCGGICPAQCGVCQQTALTCATTCSCGCAQPCGIWTLGFPGASTGGLQVAVDSSDATVVAGTFSSGADLGGGPMTSTGFGAFFVSKRDQGGGHLWTKSFLAGQGQGVTGVAVGPSNTLALAGWFLGSTDFGGGALTSAGLKDIVVVQLDQDGNHLWSKRFGGTSYDEASAVAVDAQGNVLVAGYVSSPVDFGGGPVGGSFVSSPFLAKFDANGNHIYSKAFSTPTSGLGKGLWVDAQGNAYFGGVFFQGSINVGGAALTGANALNAFLARYDASGAHVWSKGFSNAYGAGVTGNPAGDVTLFGSLGGAVDFGGGAVGAQGGSYAARFTAAGAHVWSRGFASGVGLAAGAVDGDDALVLVGGASATVDVGGGPLVSNGSSDIFFAKYDSAGSHVWSKLVGNSSQQGAVAVAADASGHLRVAGYYVAPIDFGLGALPAAPSPASNTFIASLAR